MFVNLGRPRRSFAVCGFVLLALVAATSCGSDDSEATNPLKPIEVASSVEPTSTIDAEPGVTQTAPSTTVVEADPGAISTLRLIVGDCFDLPAATDDAVDGGEVVIVDAVDGRACGREHLAEVVAVFDLEEATYPGDDVMTSIAFERCGTPADKYLGAPHGSEGLDLLTFYPTETTWRDVADRQVVCALYRLDGDQLVGTLSSTGT
jgi:hypothetical protein